MDAQSNFGSDFEMSEDEGDDDRHPAVVNESGDIFSYEEELSPIAPPAATTQWMWSKNINFQPQLYDFDERAGLKPEVLAALSGDLSPLKIWMYFIDDEMMSEICHQTNSYVAQIQSSNSTKLTNWKPLELSELKRFFGIHLLMGLIWKPALKDYWSLDPIMKTPIFGQMFSRSRFEDIYKGLHLVDNKSPTVLRTDRFWKLGKFGDQVMQKFQNIVTPGEYLSVDESLRKFKGRLSFKQYVPFKRARFGIKFFGVCDNATKHLVNYVPYLGKHSNIGLQEHKKKFGLGGAVVLHLVKDFTHCFRKICFDNWFSSPKLANKLLAVNTYCLSTVRKSRKDMPKLTEKLSKNQVETYVSNDALLERWQDRREVLMLNTFILHRMPQSQLKIPITAEISQRLY